MKRILAIGGIAIVAALLVLAAFANSQRQQADNNADGSGCQGREVRNEFAR